MTTAAQYKEMRFQPQETVVLIDILEKLEQLLTELQKLTIGEK